MKHVIYLADERDGDVQIVSPWPVEMIEVPHWQDDLSPWPMKAVFGKQDFGGQGDAFLSRLLEEIDRRIQDAPAVLAGYSLAGLFALYACTKTDRFDGCISASGSLWYKDFIPYLKAHPIHSEAAVLSLGVKEKKSRNAILASVEDCTQQVYDILSAYTKTAYVRQPGGHFADIGARMGEDVQAMAELLREK